MLWNIFKEVFEIGLFAGSTFLMAWALRHTITPLKRHKLERIWGYITAFIAGIFGLIAVSYFWLFKLFKILKKIYE